MTPSALQAVATEFLRRRPLVVAPTLAIFLATLAATGAPTAQLALTGAVGSAALSFFTWEALRGRRRVISSRHLFASLLATLLVLAFGSAATGGTRSPLLFMTFAPTVVGFAAFGRGRATDVLFVTGGLLVGALALLPPGVPFPAIGEEPARLLVVVCAASALTLLRLGVAALTDAHAAAREVAAGAGEDVVAAAAARTAALEAMGARVAHEVKNPLAAIRGLVEVVAEGTSDERDRRRLDVVRAEVERIDEILRGYLALARPLERLEPRPIDAARLVEEVSAILEARARRAGVTLAVEAASAPLDADPRRLKEALLNLVLNALSASPPGGRVALRSSARAGQVRIEVEDEGPGMSSDEAARAGEPFRSGRADGVGLGLSLVRAAAQQHGGSLEIAPGARGAGTVARLVLPAERAPAAREAP